MIFFYLFKVRTIKSFISSVDAKPSPSLSTQSLKTFSKSSLAEKKYDKVFNVQDILERNLSFCTLIILVGLYLLKHLVRN